MKLTPDITANKKTIKTLITYSSPNIRTTEKLIKQTNKQKLRRNDNTHCSGKDICKVLRCMLNTKSKTRRKSHF